MVLITYYSNAPWNLPILLENGDGAIRRYTPYSDYSIAHPDYGPVLMIGVVSDSEKESNRWRLLLHSIAVIRYQGQFCREGEQPIVMCAYLNKMYVMEIYLVYSNQETNQVVSTLLPWAHDK